MKIGLIYGTDTLSTQTVGKKIADAFNTYDIDIAVIEVSNVLSEELESFDMLILGIPTWNFGGVQSDWENFEPELLSADLNNKFIALYGLGDQEGYGDYFLDAMGWLHEKILKLGANVIGKWSITGYEIEASKALNAEKTHFVGLAIDEDNQSQLTDARIQQWVKALANQYIQLACISSPNANAEATIVNAENYP